MHTLKYLLTEDGREVDRAGDGYTEWGDKGCIYILFQMQIPASFPIFSPASQWKPWNSKGDTGREGHADCMLNESNGVKH